MSATNPALIKSTSLLKSTSVVSFMTLLSRISGLVRDMVVAHMFGAVAGVDAFFVAFRIPNFMRRLFAEGAFSQAFVPVLSEYQETKSHREVLQFTSHIAGNLGTVLLIVTALGVLGAPLIVMLFAPGFTADATRFQLASYMLRVTFPYLMLISLTAMCGALLNTYHRFAAPAFNPVLLNLVMIIAAVFMSSWFVLPVEALAWGVLIAGIVQLLFLLPFLSRASLLTRPRFNWQDAGVKRVLKLMVPALFGVSVAQINLLIDTVFASFLPVGSVTWLYYTDRLTEFPLGMFGVAISTVILPHLSRQYAKNTPHHYSQSLDWGLRLILLIGLPAAVGLFLMSGPLLATFLNYGKFTAFDVYKTRLSLMALTLGIPAFMLIKVLASGFYATQNIKTPVKIGIVAMVCNTLLCFVLIKPLAHAGLTLASALAGFINAGGLLWLLLKEKIYVPSPGWLRYGLQLLVANSLMALCLIMMVSQTSAWLSWGMWHRLITLMMDIGIAVVIYVLGLLITGVKVADFRGKVAK